MIFTIDTYNQLLDQLRAGPVVVSFTKRDGTLRTMQCTLDVTLIPSEFLREEFISSSDEDQTNRPVWDIEKKGWRSFRYDSVVSFNKL